MAIAYKSKVFSNAAANTSQALFTAVASNTLVKSIICNNDGKSTGTATLRINESGGTSKLIRRVTIASGDNSVELLYDVLALEAGDILYVTSTDTDITFIMNYAEDSEALVLQSIDVLSDVNTTGKANGNVLTWDSTSGQWEAAAPTGGGATTLDGLTDVTITAAIDHDALVYDEAALTWVNGAPKSLDMPVYAASAIAKGKLVKAVGAQGDKVSVALFDLDVDDPKYLIGLTVDAISAGGTGHVRTYGELRGISTNAYAVGTVLYASGTAGDLSTTAGVPEIPVAIVTKSQLNSGRLFIRTWSPSVAKVHSVNGETGVVVLKGDEILRSASDNSTIDGDLTTAEGNINAIKAVLKYPSSNTTGVQVDANNKLEIDSSVQKAVFTINGTSAATIGPSQSLFPQVRIGTTGNTYDLPITRGVADGEVPVYTLSTNTSEWKKLGTSNLSGDSDGITQGTTNLFLTSAERTKLTSVTSGAAVASVAGTPPIVSSGGTSPTISINAATISAAGSMSAADKTKLDGIAAGAEVNQNAFSNFAVSGQSPVVADSTTDTLTLVAGSNITLTTDAANDTITIAASSGGGGGNNFGTISVATQSPVVADAGNDTLTFVAAGGMAITTDATTDTITFDSKYLDFDDVTLQGARLIDMNGETLTLEDSTQLHPVAFFTSDSVDLREVSIRAMDNGTAGYIQLFEAANNGTNGIRLQAPTNLATSPTFTLPAADGTSGQVLSTNGSGGLSFVTKKFTQVTGKTVLTGAWSLVSGVYEATISDAAILATSIVNIIPNNNDASTIRTAGLLPRTDSSAGAVKIYSTNAPAATITVTLNIFDL